LKTKFEQRNYPSDLIESQFQKAKRKERRALIFQAPKPKNGRDDKVRLIFTHNQANPPINQWVREAKHLLRKNEKAKNIGSRIQVASRQPKKTPATCRGVQKGFRGVTKNTPRCWLL
jgi:hypothetical protein